MSSALRPLLPTLIALAFTSSASLAVTKADPNATASTQALYNNLKILQESNSTAFGQQFSTWQGIEPNGISWLGDADRSDIKTVTGSHPAVVGWNIQTYLELPDESSKALFIQRVKEAYERNSIITFHWTMKNLITLGDDRDRTGWNGYPVPGGPLPQNATILARAVTPGDAYGTNANLIKHLDDFANLLSQLTVNGRPIPILFRPFHEMHGDAQWWTDGNPAEYIAFWRYVQSYLRESKGIHHLLYVYAPGGGKMDANTTAEYLRYWPGDDAVDVCGMDLYGGDYNAYMLTTHAVASSKGMVAAFTEIGPGTGKGLYGVSNSTTWWTSNVLAAFNNPTNPLWSKTAYMMTWTNNKTNNYFVPYYSGHSQAADFVNFTNGANSNVLLLPELPPMYTTSETLTSVAAEDGWVRESSETSNVGNYKNTTELRAGDGDESARKQVKAILSFDTSKIPDDAVITGATLRMKRKSVSGTNPFSTHGILRVDIVGGYGFGGSAALANSDFEAPAAASHVVSAGMSNPAVNGDWSTGTLTSGLSTINKTGTTQFRVYFSIDDDDDDISDFMAFYSGEAAEGSQPELVITYQ